MAEPTVQELHNLLKKAFAKIDNLQQQLDIVNMEVIRMKRQTGVSSEISEEGKKLRNGLEQLLKLSGFNFNGNILHILVQDINPKEIKKNLCRLLFDFYDFNGDDTLDKRELKALVGDFYFMIDPSEYDEAFIEARINEEFSEESYNFDKFTTLPTIGSLLDAVEQVSEENRTITSQSVDLAKLGVGAKKLIAELEPVFKLFNFNADYSNFFTAVVQFLRLFLQEDNSKKLEGIIFEYMFQYYDTDKSGFIDPVELEGLVIDITHIFFREEGPKLQNFFKRLLWKEMDTNKDGQISKEEFISDFKKFMKDAASKGLIKWENATQ